MADDLIDNKLYGQGHNYQIKRGFPQGMLDCFTPPATTSMNTMPEAMAAYKPTAASKKSSQK